MQSRPVIRRSVLALGLAAGITFIAVTVTPATADDSRTCAIKPTIATSTVTTTGTAVMRPTFTGGYCATLLAGGHWDLTLTGPTTTSTPITWHPGTATSLPETVPTPALPAGTYRLKQTYPNLALGTFRIVDATTTTLTTFRHGSRVTLTATVRARGVTSAGAAPRTYPAAGQRVQVQTFTAHAWHTVAGTGAVASSSGKVTVSLTKKAKATYRVIVTASALYGASTSSAHKV